MAWYLVSTGITLYLIFIRAKYCAWSSTSIPSHIFITWCLIKQDTSLWRGTY